MFRKNALFLSYLVLALILLIGSSSQKLTKANFLSGSLYFPFINSLISLEDIFQVQAENAKLINSLADKTLRVNLLENSLKYYRETQTDLNIPDYEIIVSDVVGYSGNYNERNLIINSGHKIGVQRNYPVFSSAGMVGKVVETSQNYSVIMPFNHPAFKLGVMTKNTQVQGILESDVYGNTSMGMINMGSEISLGDTIITSNISSYFPKNIPVGIVSRITDSNDKVHIDAFISPFTNPYGLDKLFVLFFSKDKDYENELETKRK